MRPKAKLFRRQKQMKLKQMYSICIIVDNFADDPKIMHAQGGYASGGSMLNTLFIRGRHLHISTLVSTQKLRLISSTIRVNAQSMLVWRLRNRTELQSLLEELSAVYPMDMLLEMYNMATEEPYSFWSVLLTAKRRRRMFYLRFEHKMVPEINNDDDGDLR